MKIEWWCETSENGFTRLVAKVNQGPMFYSPISWNCDANEQGRKALLALVHLYVMEQIDLLHGPFPTCPKGEVAELEWPIFYPQGLFKLPKPKLRLVIHDGCDKQLKFKPPVGKGPRGRWGK